MLLHRYGNDSDVDDVKSKKSFHDKTKLSEKLSIFHAKLWQQPSEAGSSSLHKLPLKSFLKIKNLKIQINYSC